MQRLYHNAMPEEALSPQDENASSIEQQVREEVEELKGFYIHTGIYVLINLLLIVINLITTPEYFWAIWPLLGWGVGIGAHAIAIFGLFGIGSQAWEERKVRELMLQRQRGLNAEQVRALLHEELHAETRTADTDPTDLDRILRRLENLEAIVTSQEWDQIENPPEAPPHLPETRLGTEEKPQDPAEDAARLARRVR